MKYKNRRNFLIYCPTVLARGLLVQRESKKGNYILGSLTINTNNGELHGGGGAPRAPRTGGAHSQEWVSVGG
jgi:hypothetical protein